MMNGDSRKNMLQTMSILVGAVIIGGGVLYYMEAKAGNTERAGQIFEYLEHAGLLLIGMFIAVGRSLFNVDTNKPVIIQTDKDGNVKLVDKGGV